MAELWSWFVNTVSDPVKGVFGAEGVELWLTWLVLAAIFFLVELVHFRWVVIWFGFGAIAAAVTAAIAPNLVALQMAVFFAVSIALVIFSRPITKRLLFGGERAVVTNAPSYVGRTVECIEDVGEGCKKGAVRLYGSPWNARSAKEGVVIKAGELARVVAMEDLCLWIEPFAPEESEYAKKGESGEDRRFDALDPAERSGKGG